MFSVIVAGETGTEVWRRDCYGGDLGLGCTQRRHEITGELIDECICDKGLCNAEMGPISETTTPKVTTTSTGITIITFQLKYAAQ